MAERKRKYIPTKYELITGVDGRLRARLPSGAIVPAIRLEDGSVIVGEAVPQPAYKLSLTRQLKVYLAAHPALVEALIETWVGGAIAGDAVKFKTLLDRTEGAVMQRLSVGALSTEQLVEALSALPEDELFDAVEPVGEDDDSDK